MNRSPLHPTRLPLRSAAAAACLLGTLGVHAADVDTSRLPPPATHDVSYGTEIKPILDRVCVRCHGPERPRSKFRLDAREAALAGGNNGVDILPGDSANSPLIHYVAGLVEDMEMPPSGQGDPLKPEEIGLLRAWIDQGASWSEAVAKPEFTFEVTPAIQFYTVSGNEARFREHNWTREGWGGGASDFRLKYTLDPRTRMEMEGRALAGREEYRIVTRVERDELGWARLAYRQFNRYYDDTGGYYAPFAMDAPRLGDDLVVRHHQATLEFGLELPEWPTFRVAYDVHLRDGTESTLHWGSWIDGNVSRNIVPGRKEVDETTHRVTLDIRYDWDGLLIANESQFEWHEQDNRRLNHDLTAPGFDFATATTDRQDYWRGANVLRIERSVRDWLYLSGGYLYSQLEDAGGFSVESFSPSDPTQPPSLDLTTDDLTLRRRSHVINANAMLGPWEKLHFYAGLQAEWTRQEGFAIGRTYGLATAYDANTDRAATDEHFGLRYAGIPFTVIHVETRFQQESYSQFEEGLSDQQSAFLRDSDAEGDLKDYEAGFTVSPWQRFSLGAKFRHRDRENHYDHFREADLFSGGNGYPAFIRARDTTSDEVETRVVVQPLKWLKTTLKYTVAATDFETETAGWEDVAQVPPVTYPGGSILAGQYDAHAVSAGFVLTPWRRLHLGTTLTWSTSRSLSGVNNEQEVAPYEGETWNLFNTATYILDEKTDLMATYLYSRADFSQDNADFTVPLGIEYTRHVATIGVSRRMKHDRLLRLEYGFFNYDEPTLGGAADYTAHGLFASFRVPWP